ncbi:MAG: hypothetical protein F9K18_04105 [Thermoanaerobaculia bacterium]|nr:MAG: hypothetical protein F9K18_04105 [Thermoanaerobaculia bacterium]
MDLEPDLEGGGRDGPWTDRAACGGAVLRASLAGSTLSRRLLASLAGLLATSACGRLETIPCDPPQTPESWLASQPHVEVAVGSHRLVLVQPSTSAIVFALGLLTIGIGVRLLSRREGQRSRLAWGVALGLWGAGALLAGTSYEAFSYAIKCAGRATCAWTSWWEVGYLLLSGASVGAMVLGTAHACAAGRLRRALSAGAVAGVALYLAVVLTGAFVPVRFLVSFELLVLCAAPGFAALLVLSARRWRRGGDLLDRALLRAWLGLAAVFGAYCLYLGLGAGAALWAKDIWFSGNDVLHVGLIAWMLHLAAAVLPRLRDLPEA